LGQFTIPEVGNQFKRGMFLNSSYQCKDIYVVFDFIVIWSENIEADILKGGDGPEKKDQLVYFSFNSGGRKSTRNRLLCQ